MRKIRDLLSIIKEYINESNTMLVEVEMEGEVVNQSWHEYDTCEVLEGKNGILVFTFFIKGRKSGAFITKVEDIGRYELFQEEDTTIPLKHVYIHVQGKKKQPLLVGEMKDIFTKNVPLSDNFSITHLYNPNRSNVHVQDKSVLQTFFESDLFEIHKYEIEIEEKEEKDIFRVFGYKDYPQEPDGTVQAFLDMVELIEEKGYEVKRNEGIGMEEPLTSVYARGYVPEWDLMISATSQNINTILDTFAQKDKRVCIVSADWHVNKPKRITAYLVERKKKFHEVYRLYQEEKTRRKLELMEKMSKGFDDLFKQHRSESE
ncbi:hypothetical protein CVD28_02530 [Bacillus sp. M6-12]|uniref:hypothetical protein n=1 Tax=Bacillus sp. M6-12 TaxID=2054166 RepID=UPI000C78E220|nr:hypothetical protein [Bacillus sp. M6-12]PLS19308.1 hypothetical protein CVD28_02530 [Bacillus sp. M6-12]